MALVQLGLPQEKEKYDELVKSLQDITACPVCLHPLHPETVMCVNGHVICQGCRGDQAVCPTCRKVFADVQQLTFVQQVLRAVPRQCRFKPCGADVRAEDDHEKYCGFRPTRCRVPSCGWKGSCGELGEHYKRKHWWNRRFLFGCLYSSNTPFDVHNNFLGVKLYNMTLKQLIWIDIKYDPNRFTSLSFFPVLLEKLKSNIITLTLSLESVSLDLKSVLETKLNLEDEMSRRENRTTVSSTTIIQFYETQDSRLKITWNQG